MNDIKLQDEEEKQNEKLKNEVFLLSETNSNILKLNLTIEIINSSSFFTQFYFNIRIFIFRSQYINWHSSSLISVCFYRY